MLNELIFAFAVAAICAFIHVSCMVYFARWLLKWRLALEQDTGVRKAIFGLILVFAILIFLHVGEAALWGWFYYARSLFANYETSLYFSLTSYTTIGYGDVVLPQKWRLLGAIEGITGVLLCGLSAGFVFAIVTAIFQIRLVRLSER